MKRTRALVLLLLGLLCGCDRDEPRPEAASLLLASTTSTEDSGLFGELVPAFEEAHPAYDVKVVAVGTGEALGLGRRKDADVLLVHDPAAESAFVAEGHGTERREVMYNDFVLVGPASDPASLRGMSDAAAALRRIAEQRARFVSRGDDSGTHRKELALWEAAGGRPPPDAGWYREAGQGMSEVLRIADEMEAYTLADRGTFLSMRDGLDLELVLEGDPRLFNPYGVIPVAGARNPEGARAFSEWITSPEGQEVIGRFGMERFGQPLFRPSARTGG